MPSPEKRPIQIDWRSPKAELAAERVLRLPTAMDLGIADALNMALEDVAEEVLGKSATVTDEVWAQRTEDFAYMLAVMTDVIWSVCTAADGTLDRTDDGSPMPHGTMLNGFLGHWRERYGPAATEPPAG